MALDIVNQACNVEHALNHAFVSARPLQPVLSRRISDSWVQFSFNVECYSHLKNKLSNLLRDYDISYSEYDHAQVVIQASHDDIPEFLHKLERISIVLAQRLSVNHNLSMFRHKSHGFTANLSRDVSISQARPSV